VRVHRSSPAIGPLSALADVLASWSDGDGPLYARLATSLGVAIRGGRLGGGMRLPPERRLGEYLAIGRNTVVRAYAVLEADGLVTRRQGSGTLVATPAVTVGLSRGELSAVTQGNVVLRLVADSAADSVDLLGAHALLDSDVDRVIRDAISAVDASDALRQAGYFPLGYPPLRTAIARHLSARGLPTDADQILVTNGAQQAISVIGMALIRGKRNVVVEDPTFPGAIDSFRLAGGRLLSVPVLAGGTDLDRLSDLVEDTDIAFAYLMPTFHNPTGALMPTAARQRLAELVEATGLVLVEDDALAELALADPQPLSVAAFARRGTVLTIGSLSKLFWGGLRVGWIRGPREMISQLGQVKATLDLGSGVVSQLAALRLLDHAPSIRQRRRTQIAESLERLEGLLATKLPSWSWVRPAGGLSLWARLPFGSATELARVASRHHVAIVPGSVMSPRGGFDEYLRLPLGRDGETMALAIRRLTAAWEDYVSAAGPSGDRLAVVV
jgi:DNA-binding transcriptional MocR family regulator